MLLNTFFKIVSTEASDGAAKVKIELLPKHRIYEGHFPGMPVVPGVCMMQILKECIEIIVSRKIKFSIANQIKFLAIIEPSKTNEFQLMIDYSYSNELLNVTASLINSEIIYFKFKGAFTIK